MGFADFADLISIMFVVVVTGLVAVLINQFVVAGTAFYLVNELLTAIDFLYMRNRFAAALEFGHGFVNYCD